MFSYIMHLSAAACLSENMQNHLGTQNMDSHACLLLVELNSVDHCCSTVAYTHVHVRMHAHTLLLDTLSIKDVVCTSGDCSTHYIHYIHSIHTHYIHSISYVYVSNCGPHSHSQGSRSLVCSDSPTYMSRGYNPIYTYIHNNIWPDQPLCGLRVFMVTLYK